MPKCTTEVSRLKAVMERAMEGVYMCEGKREGEKARKRGNLKSTF